MERLLPPLLKKGLKENVGALQRVPVFGQNPALSLEIHPAEFLTE